MNNNAPPLNLPTPPSASQARPNSDATARQFRAILRIKQVQARTGLSRSSIYEKLKPSSKYRDETFPRPMKLSVAAIGWFEHDIDEWLASRYANSVAAIQANS